jgi:hypothetical protein
MLHYCFLIILNFIVLTVQHCNLEKNVKTSQNQFADQVHYNKMIRTYIYTAYFVIGSKI